MARRATYAEEDGHEAEHDRQQRHVRRERVLRISLRCFIGILRYALDDECSLYEFLATWVAYLRVLAHRWLWVVCGVCERDEGAKRTKRVGDQSW